MQPRSRPLCDTKNNNRTNLGTENNVEFEKMPWKVRAGGNDPEGTFFQKKLSRCHWGGSISHKLSGAGIHLSQSAIGFMGMHNH